MDECDAVLFCSEEVHVRGECKQRRTFIAEDGKRDVPGKVGRSIFEEEHPRGEGCQVGADLRFGEGQWSSMGRRCTFAALVFESAADLAVEHAAGALARQAYGSVVLSGDEDE